MITILLNWYGPYTDDTLEEEKEFGNGIYLITGKKPYERNPTIQYCGITQNSFHHRFLTHHKKDEVTRERQYWLAEVIYPKRTSRELLEIAETIIIYFWQPPLNKRKTVYPPNPTTVMNQRFNREGKARVNQLYIYRDLSDVISWDGENWRTVNLKVWCE